ncbi:hypothetical protein CSKR_103164 [Clonorchis sinensis]|uniref:Uncharacterized protein n=2 Tax=Clonorchis sinensis TaxID=79923 RepID=A0A8T1LYK1_CLOSI|nr:hypothetical protein CSKR_103164 [Clonorchis sinensis]GAA56155.1 hypothetical protein CLF_110129 [Clonorchis sinensis]
MAERKATLFVLTAILLMSGEDRLCLLKYFSLANALKCFDCDTCPEDPKEGNVTVKDGCGACLIARANAGNGLNVLAIKCFPTCTAISGVELGNIAGVKRTVKFTNSFFRIMGEDVIYSKLYKSRSNTKANQGTVTIKTAV